MKSTEIESNKWIELTSFPFANVSQQFLINNNEFLAAVSIKNKNVNGDGVYKFNTIKNEWIKIFDYDNDFECIVNSAAYDLEHKLLYVHNTLRYP